MTNTKVTTARINVRPTSVSLHWTDGVSGGCYGSAHGDEWIETYTEIAKKRWPNAKIVVRRF